MSVLSSVRNNHILHVTIGFLSSVFVTLCISVLISKDCTDDTTMETCKEYNQRWNTVFIIIQLCMSGGFAFMMYRSYIEHKHVILSTIPWNTTSLEEQYLILTLGQPAPYDYVRGGAEEQQLKGIVERYENEKSTGAYKIMPDFCGNGSTYYMVRRDTILEDVLRLNQSNPKHPYKIDDFLLRGMSHLFVPVYIFESARYALDKYALTYYESQGRIRPRSTSF